MNFLGIGTPQRRAIGKPLLRTLKGIGAQTLLAHASALWMLPQREYQYVALDMLAMHWQELPAADIPSLFALAADKPWCDTVDALADIIGDVLRRDHAHMDAALIHNNLWIRRIALLQ